MVGKARSGDVVILGGVAELSTEGGHGDVEGFGWAIPVLVPDLAHELLPADSRRGVCSESGEQIELLRPQCQVIAVDVAPPGSKINGECS